MELATTVHSSQQLPWGGLRLLHAFAGSADDRGQDPAAFMVQRPMTSTPVQEQH